MEKDLKLKLIKGLDKMPKLILIPLVLTAFENSKRICESDNEKAKKLAEGYMDFLERLTKVWSED